MVIHDLSLKEVPPDMIFDDRWAQPRCSIRLPMEFMVVGNKLSVGQIGTGFVLNMSSTGIAFHTRDEVECGSFVNVWIPWFSDPSDCVTTLQAYGRVVRNSQEVTAIHVWRYEFSKEALLGLFSPLTIEK